MHRALLLLLAGLVYILGFGALSFVRRQGLPLRFALEGVAVTLACAALAYLDVPVSPLAFLIAIYLVTMRVRLLVDVGNWVSSRGQFPQALGVFRLALRLGGDDVGRRMVLINRGVAELRQKDPQRAYETLTAALAGEHVQPGARHLSAGLYNLGLAARRTGREAEARRRFQEAIEALPTSIYAHAADRALKEGPGREAQMDTDEHG